MNLQNQEHKNILIVNIRLLSLITMLSTVAQTDLLLPPQ